MSKDTRIFEWVLNAQHQPVETTTQREGGSVDYTVGLSSLEEIARWVVGFGGKCRVVEPGDLQEVVNQLATGAIQGRVARS